VDAPVGWYSALIRRHHLHHHFRNPKANHGVTSPVWDHVFRTAETTELVRIPRKLAPFWLTDDRHVGFELRGKAR
jgi:sterol desaturase/sphingolipid hydroxylase (fatty acid hydroxylase superfamily)